MIIDSKVAGEYPDPSKEGKGLSLRNEAGFGAVKSPRPAPSINEGGRPWVVLLDYLSTKD